MLVLLCPVAAKAQVMSGYRCPLCGERIKGDLGIRFHGNFAMLGTTPILVKEGTLGRRMLELLVERPGGLSRPSMVEHGFAHRVDGGPLNAGSVVSIEVGRLNKKLAPDYEITDAVCGNYTLRRVPSRCGRP